MNNNNEQLLKKKRNREIFKIILRNGNVKEKPNNKRKNIGGKVKRNKKAKNEKDNNDISNLTKEFIEEQKKAFKDFIEKFFDDLQKKFYIIPK